jgi:hypothetical protein
MMKPMMPNPVMGGITPAIPPAPKAPGRIPPAFVKPAAKKAAKKGKK